MSTTTELTVKVLNPKMKRMNMCMMTMFVANSIRDGKPISEIEKENTK